MSASNIFGLLRGGYGTVLKAAFVGPYPRPSSILLPSSVLWQVAASDPSTNVYTVFSDTKGEPLDTCSAVNACRQTPD
jgi:hypothetical protein